MARISPYSPTEPPAETSLLNFPEKLWWIVNNPKRGEIHWNSEGTSIVIPNSRKFVDEILNSPSSALFKTKNFSSFVRQLNLYGFRKVTEYPKETVHSPLLVSLKSEFKHTYFRKGRRDLLVNVKRHLYTPRKSENKQQRKAAPLSEEKPSDYNSPNLTWNPTLYTPMPFIPWQASFQMPFTLYAPFCNAHQLAQMQQGPVASVTNIQGLGILGQLQQSPVNPPVGSDGSVKCVSSFAPPQLGAGGVVFVPSHGNLPKTTTEDTNGLNSPLMTKLTVDAATKAHRKSNASLSTYCMDTDSSTKRTDQLTVQRNDDVTNNSSATNCIFTAGYTSVSSNNKPILPAENNAPGSFQGTTHALNEKLADSFQAGTNTFVMKQNKDIPAINHQEGFSEEFFHQKFLTQRSV